MSRPGALARHRPTAQVVLAAVSLQSGSAIATTLFDDLGAPGLLALRMGVGALVLWLLTRSWRHLPTRSAWPLVVAFGAALGTMNLLFYLAIERVPLGVAVALELLGPLAVAVAGSRRVKELGWAALAVVGVLVLVGPEIAHATGLAGGPGGEPLDLPGVLAALGAGGCWAVYIVLGARLARVVPGSTGLAWAMVAASVVLVPLGVATAGSALLDPRLLLSGVAVALMSAVLPYSLEMSAMREVGARTFGVMMSLEPAVAALAGLVIVGQLLDGWTVLGIAAVGLATFGAVARRSPAAPHEAPAPAPVVVP